MIKFKTYIEPVKTSSQVRFLGSSVKITAVLDDVATADSAVITVYDPNETAKVSSANMTKEADGIYSYTFQTTSTWDGGEYIALITLSDGTYTSIDEVYIEFEKQTVE